MRDASSWIQTYSGIKFYPLDPRPEDVSIVDIAHALGNVCRFAGHVSEHYSVAQHSVLVSQLVPPEDALWGLMHDAAEAYTGDLPRPIKKQIPQWAGIENRLLDVIAQRFNLRLPVPTSVWYFDNVILSMEARDLFVGGPVADWTSALGCEPMLQKIETTLPQTAAHRFLRRAAELGIGVL
jgi:hypothetical protein